MDWGPDIFYLPQLQMHIRLNEMHHLFDLA